MPGDSCSKGYSGEFDIDQFLLFDGNIAAIFVDVDVLLLSNCQPLGFKLLRCLEYGVDLGNRAWTLKIFHMGLSSARPVLQSVLGFRCLVGFGDGLMAQVKRRSSIISAGRTPRVAGTLKSTGDGGLPDFVLTRLRGATSVPVCLVIPV